ncbi:MAG TPA: glycosyltransferase family 2 protein [Methylocella sp.]|nr:glycosyltransferase family 2 protein [Methylocella sp.]
MAAPPTAGLPVKLPLSLHPRAAPERRPAALPAALAFLTVHGVSPAVLLTAAAEARRQAIAPEAAVLASGTIRERFFYQCLAHRLGSAFIDGEIALGAGARYPHAVHAGLAPLDGGDGSRWLAAPRGQLLTHLLARARGGERLGARLAITTPSHLSSLVRAASTASILREASLGLANLDPSLSAKERPSHAQCTSAMAAAAAGTLAFGLAPAATLTVVSLSMTCLFLASIWLRLFAGAASTGCREAPFRARVEDRRLPVYSVVVALHREARVVPQLVAALTAIDYPRGKLDIKLDIKLVIERDDRATRLAIEASDLPATYEIVVAPGGWPRTKPRALNIALPLVRGELLVIFDAEDAPASGQLREAAERFLRAPRELACLQARLAIDNIEDSWLTRLFAIEYAVLFDVLNPGLAGLGLPLPLGGSSNHFRTEVLREVCGWDAWNVTEDADLGLRLARFGYGVGVLPSSTQEEAPAHIDTWLRQRRRWSKGWMQTLITLTRDPRRLVSELGVAHSLALALTMTGLVIAPPLWPFFTALLVHDLGAGLPSPASAFELIEVVLWMSAGLFGTASIVWLALLGMKRRKLLGLWPFLPLLPLYYLLTSAAAWMAIYDLILRPYHWHKTEHGLAKTSRQSLLTLAGRAAAVRANLL